MRNYYDGRGLLLIILYKIVVILYCYIDFYSSQMRWYDGFRWEVEMERIEYMFFLFYILFLISIMILINIIYFFLI